MSDWYLGIAVFLLLNMIAGMWRVLRGPTAADRLLAAQLFATTGVAILLLMAEVMHMPAARDVALVLALLAVLAVEAFLASGGLEPEREERRT